MGGFGSSLRKKKRGCLCDFDVVCSVFLKVHHSSTTIHTQWFPKIKKSDTEINYGVGGFQKSYVIFGGGISKYLLFLTGVGGCSEKDQEHPYVI